jgi:hypothetical protein
MFTGHSVLLFCYIWHLRVTRTEEKGNFFVHIYTSKRLSILRDVMAYDTGYVCVI